MNIEIFKRLILDLSDLIVIFNEDLKKGKIQNIIPESTNVFNQFINLDPELNKIINLEPKFGLNIILVGLTGKILYPSFLYKNSYRLQIRKQLRYFLTKENSFENKS